MTEQSLTRPTWRAASTAPLDRNVEVLVEGAARTYILKFPCRRTEAGWVNAIKSMRLAVEPTHWREISLRA
jgi:hypothetical protein